MFKFLGGQRKHERKHNGFGGTLVTKRIKGQCRAHRKAGQEREERTVVSKLQAKRIRSDVEYPCGRHDFLKDLVVSKKDMQRTAPGDCQRTIHEELKELKELEEQRAKESLLLVEKKHKLIKWEGERKRARTMQRLEVTRTMSPWSGHARSCSSPAAPNTDEAMSATSRMAQEMGEAKSEASWTALAKEKERDWWSADLEGEVEELEVVCPFDGNQRRLNGSRRGDEPPVRWQKGCN